MLAKPEWNPERYEAPRKPGAEFHTRSADRYLKMAKIAAGTSFLLASYYAMH